MKTIGLTVCIIAMILNIYNLMIGIYKINYNGEIKMLNLKNQCGLRL